MAPFEALNGRRCQTPLNWIKPGEKTIFGPDRITKAEAIVRRIQDNLKVVLALIKHRFHTPTCRVNVWNNHVFTLSTNLVPRF
jgi:hypothetical protein